MSDYTVQEFIDPQKLRDDLEIDPRDLSMSMMRQAGLFAYYCTVAAQAEKQMGQMEQLQEIIEARLDKKVRDAAVAAGTKITEAQVKAQIALEPKAIAIRTAVNKARMVASICKSGADSFRHRRDMMIQLALNDREERKGELRLHENNHERAASAQEQRRQRMEGMRDS
jgi:hypothetical protein